ncbi:MAG TPA: hypothetical protein VGC42_28175, partial [Kofleriaceae bacterium]
MTVLAFLGLEIVFKLVFVRAFGNAFAPGRDHGWVSQLYLEATVPVGVAWLLAVFALTGRHDRLSRDGAPAHAVRIQRRLPDELTAAWAANWGATLALVALRAPEIASRESVFCLLLAVLLGSTILAHTFTSWLVESRLRHAGAGPARRLFGSASPRSLRLRLIAYGMGLGLAPTMYLGSLAFSIRMHTMSRSDVLTDVMLQAGST